MTLFLEALILGIFAGGLYALMSSGLTLVFGVMRLINIGHAAIVFLASYLSWTLLVAFGLDPLLSIPVVAVIFFVVGAALQRSMLGILAQRDLSLALLATLGIANIIEGSQGWIWTSTNHAIVTSYSDNTYAIGSVYVPLIRAITFAVSLLLLLALWLLMTRTNLGRAIRATTQNRGVAQLVGVNVEQVTMIAFGIGMATAAAAGPLLGMITPFYPNFHWAWIGKLMAIVILGGLGSFRGTLVASLILGIAESVTILFLSPNWAAMVFFVFLFAVLLVRPQGLFGHVARDSL